MANSPLSKHGREVVLYLLVGVVGLGVDSVVFFAGLQAGYAPIMAQWGGASVGAIHNAIWHHFAVFDHDKSLHRTAVPNVAIAIATVGISGPLLQLAVNLGTNIVITKIFILAGMTIVGYFLRKFLVFRED